MNPDIDIDTQSSFDFKKYFNDWVRASVLTEGHLRKHAVGCYPQNMPEDPISGLAAIPYDDASEFFKVDFLHIKIYDYFQSREQIEALVKAEPDWVLLKSPGVVKQLFQLSKHFETVQKIKPKTVEELADVLALIRPGKAWLIEKYLENKDTARKYLYKKGNEDDEYSFKKSHSVAYALVVVLQLHLISAGIEFI